MCPRYTFSPQQSRDSNPVDSWAGALQYCFILTPNPEILPGALHWPWNEGEGPQTHQCPPRRAASGTLAFSGVGRGEHTPTARDLAKPSAKRLPPPGR